MQLRSCCAQYIYDRNYNRIGLLPRGHAPSRPPVKKLRRLLNKRRKLRVLLWKGIRKNIISFYSSVFTINPDPRRRSVRSHSVLLTHRTYLGNCHGEFFSSFLRILGNFPRQLHPEEIGQTQKVVSPWATAIFPWVKSLV